MRILPVILIVAAFWFLVYRNNWVDTAVRIHETLVGFQEEQQKIENAIRDAIEDAGGLPKQVQEEPAHSETSPPKEVNAYASAAEPGRKALIVQHTIDSCIWCKYDAKEVFPLFEAVGWEFGKPIDETKSPVVGRRYPWYEIFDRDGSLTLHIGSLSTYKKKPNNVLRSSR